MTEKEFNDSLMRPVQFSLATSKIAVEKATNKNVKEFAGFEQDEAIAITTVLKGLGALVIEMSEEEKTGFGEIDSTGPGPEFDKLYIRLQLENHRMLRDLTEDYLHEAPTENLDLEESHGQNLAIIALAIFKEHIIITERISGELGIEE